MQEVSRSSSSQSSSADMSPTRYTPSPSSDNENAGKGYTWMLEHVLAYPVSYEIPLRTMYTLNSAPRAQPLPHQPSRPGSGQSNAGRATTPEGTSPGGNPQRDAAAIAAEHFKSNLMAQISHLPSQPCSLPPSFITSFVRRCFSDDLTLVDFPQALTGMDYLRDMEARRRRELTAALRRLGINKNSVAAVGEQTTRDNPAITTWVQNMEKKERKVEALFTQVYVGLRRWTLINEMSLLPFNKSNCLAMLNTLYPPSVSSQPTMQLTPEVLQGQRNGFWRYIQSVEKNGPRVLENIMAQGRDVQRGDENGWLSVREVLDKYLRAANAVIDECTAVIDLESFTQPMDGDDQRRNGRKVDSGVSFSSDDRPSTSSSSTRSKDKPLPSPPSPVKQGSTLEKIARELRKLRDRNKVEECAGLATHQEKLAGPKVKSLKKMRSTGALGNLQDRNKSFVSSADRSKSPATTFDVNEQARKKAIEEALEASARPRLKHKPLMSFET